MTTRPICFLLALGATAIFTSSCGGDTGGSGGSGGAGSTTSSTGTSAATSSGAGGEATGQCANAIQDGSENDVDCGVLC